VDVTVHVYRNDAFEQLVDDGFVFAVGSNSLPAVKSLVEEADFVLWIGAIETDVNTGVRLFPFLVVISPS
jgi:hypothetical protein